jgi:hypothetical protein
MRATAASATVGCASTSCAGGASFWGPFALRVADVVAGIVYRDGHVEVRALDSRTGIERAIPRERTVHY